MSGATLYRFDPVGLDLFDRRPSQPEPGAVVRKVQPHGCPRNGTMGHVYVETADDSPARGPVLVLRASVRPLTRGERQDMDRYGHIAAWRNLYDAAAKRVADDEELSQYAEYIMADWPEGEEHWTWVATAPREEIIDWAACGVEGR